MISPLRKSSPENFQTAKLIQFPTDYGNTTSNASLPDNLIEDLFVSENFNEEIKHIIEGKISEILINLINSEPMINENPFGSIYLSALMPDDLNQKDVNHLKVLSDITDLSNSITFDDGWDD
mgnify:CR=1 FL=1